MWPKKKSPLQRPWPGINSLPRQWSGMNPLLRQWSSMNPLPRHSGISPLLRQWSGINPLPRQYSGINPLPRVAWDQPFTKAAVWDQSLAKTGLGLIPYWDSVTHPIDPGQLKKFSRNYMRRGSEKDYWPNHHSMSWPNTLTSYWQYLPQGSWHTQACHVKKTPHSFPISCSLSLSLSLSQTHTCMRANCTHTIIFKNLII